jgi:hypothetical protein
MIGIAFAVFTVALGFFLLREPFRNSVFSEMARWALFAIAALGLTFLVLRIHFLAAPVIAGTVLLLFLCKRSKPIEGEDVRSRSSSEKRQEALIEISVDSETGDVAGRILRGEYAGLELVDLQLPELQKLLESCIALDKESVGFLRQYLDSAYGDWEFCRSNDSMSDERYVQDHGMTREEAIDVLGLTSGSGPQEVRRAFRRFARELHPDRGGSIYRFQQIVRARDILLGPE